MPLTPHFMFTCLVLLPAGTGDSRPGAVMTPVMLSTRVLVHFSPRDQELQLLEVGPAQVLLVVAAGLWGEQVVWGVLSCSPPLADPLPSCPFQDSRSPPCSL